MASERCRSISGPGGPRRVALPPKGENGGGISSPADTLARDRPPGTRPPKAPLGHRSGASRPRLDAIAAGELGAVEGGVGCPDERRLVFAAAQRRPYHKKGRPKPFVDDDGCFGWSLFDQPVLAKLTEAQRIIAVLSMTQKLNTKKLLREQVESRLERIEKRLEEVVATLDRIAPQGRRALRQR